MESERGFTAIEILVTLAILGLAISAYLSVTVLTIQFHHRSRATSEAILLAQEGMEILKSRGWDEALSGCEVGPAGPDGVEAPHRWEKKRGVDYCIVFEKESVDSFLDVCRVSCFWDNGKGRLEKRCGVWLSTLERKVSS